MKKRLLGTKQQKDKSNQRSVAVSVITCCYNAARFLEEAIESVIGQSYNDFEHILIDDGSTDSTPEIISSYENRDRRIKLIRKVYNTGPSDSRNKGIAVARGEWVAILDADDVAMPNKLERQLKFVRENGNIALVGSDFIEIDELGNRIKEHDYPSNHRKLVQNLEHKGKFFPHSSALFPTRLAKDIGIYHPHFDRCMDLDLFLRLSRKGTLYCINLPLVKVRKYRDSYSRSNDVLQQTYGMAAVVCHFLRTMTKNDPSNGDRNEWLVFMQWLEKRLFELGYFSQNQLREQIRKIFPYRGNGIQFRKTLLMTNQIMRQLPQMFGMLHRKISKYDLPSQLAMEWESFRLSGRISIDESY